MTQPRIQMNQPRPLTNEEGEVREITAEDMKYAKRIHQMPEAVQAVFRTREPRKPTKK